MTYSTPMGVSDYLPADALKLEKFTSVLQGVFQQSEFLPIKTPTIEFSESLERGLGPLLRKQCIEFFDPSGHRLMLRPDNTTPIARTVATRMKEHALPIKVSYVEPIFRKSDQATHSDTEIFQAGCEYFGYNSMNDIADTISLCVEGLRCIGIDDIGVDIGHVSFASDLDDDRRSALLAGDYLAFGEIPARGQHHELCENNDLSIVFESLVKREFGNQVFINKGLVQGIYYYTGVVFEVYSKRLRRVVASGGQYDSLCSRFGKDIPAFGFAIGLNHIYGDLHE